MTYEKLSDYYDQFVDDDLTELSYKLITKYYKEGTCIDIGTGTAPLAIKLAKSGFFVTGTDINEKMLEKAYNNAVKNDVHINFYIHNILDPLNITYDVIAMTSDVINYLENESEVIQALNNIKNAMHEESIFLFDFIHLQYMNRLNGYKEDILLNDELLQWSVSKTNVPNQIKHRLKFGNFVETHYQTTYPYKRFKELLKECGFVIKRKRKTEERFILLCKLK